MDIEERTIRIEPKTSEPEHAVLLSEDTAHPLHPTAADPPNPISPNAPGAESELALDGTSQASTSRKSESRNRPPRLSPLASIRLHLQAGSRPSDILSAHKVEDGRTRITDHDQPVTRAVGQPNDDSSSVATNHTMVANTTLSPTAVEKSSAMHAKAPSNGEIVDPIHVSGNLSDTTSPTPVVSYSILGAAARSKVQPPLITAPAPDSTQRGIPTSVNGPTLGRTRLLARLEAAKAEGLATITDDDTSHLSTKAGTAPTQPEVPESPVSDSQEAAMQELRLRLAARSRLARSATSPSGNDGSGPSQNGHGHVEPADDNSPAARMEAERRLKLHARRAVRKRDINAVMGAGSSADTHPR